jgi:hypothetical protein
MMSSSTESMEEFCLENHFVFELYTTRGFPLEDASELGY